MDAGDACEPILPSRWIRGLAIGFKSGIADERQQIIASALAELPNKIRHDEKCLLESKELA